MSAVEGLRELFETLPDDLRRQALTHSSWVARRSESYDRLAFLGDSVLELAITTHLWPLLDPDDADYRADLERVLRAPHEAAGHSAHGHVH